MSTPIKEPNDVPEYMDETNKFDLDTGTVYSAALVEENIIQLVESVEATREFFIATLKNLSAQAVCCAALVQNPRTISPQRSAIPTDCAEWGEKINKLLESVKATGNFVNVTLKV
jgi:hypothetical protein